MFSIAVGKISVALLIERIAAPSDRRKWLLRGISISVFVSAVITFTLFYAQCQPVRAIWDKSMIKDGTGSCWNPIPVNTWNLVIASKLAAFARRNLMLIFNHSRLLGILGFCPRFDPRGYRLEAAIEHAEKISIDASFGYGGLVSYLPSYPWTRRAYQNIQSAGICAAVKTSKVPITVEAKTDITCKFPPADRLPLEEY